MLERTGALALLFSLLFLWSSVANEEAPMAAEGDDAPAEPAAPDPERRQGSLLASAAALSKVPAREATPQLGPEEAPAEEPPTNETPS